MLVVGAAGAVAIWLKPWAPAEQPAPVGQATLPLPDKPSIAILPFDNLSGESEQEYFADGITEDITTELSRFRDLFVIARTSAFVYKGKAVNVREVGRELGVRYVLEGSVRRSGTTVRINAQLVDVATGAHLWAERYDRDMRDVFAVHDEVTQKIVSAIGTTQLPEAAKRRVSRKNPKDLEAYDLNLRAFDQWLRFTPEDNAEARVLYMRAAALDPSYSRPHSGLAWTHLQEVFLGWSHRPAESLQSAFVSAQRAVALDDSDSWEHWALGAVYLHMGQHDRALAAYERALTLNPNDADNLAHYGGFALVFAGRPEEGIEAVAKAKLLNPHYPWWYAFGLGRAYFTARRYDEAIEAWRDKTAPGGAVPLIFIAAAHAQAGRLDEARAMMDKFRQAAPGGAVSGMAASEPYKEPADLQHLLDGLRVRPETLCRITEFSEHESNGRELDEGERVAVEVLPVLGQSAAAVEPGDGAFDHPTPGLDDEALHPIGSLDDLGLEIGQDAGQGAVKDRPLIGAVGEQFPEKGKQTEQGRQQRETAVAILNVGGGDDAVQQQALRIDQNMPLLALDQLAGIEAVAVDASPPFSALFTL